VTTALLGGAAFSVTDLMRGELGVGVLDLDNRDPTQGDRRSVAVSSSLEVFMTQLMTATIDVQRSSAAADLEDFASYIDTSASIGVDYELRRNVIVSLRFSRSRREYN